MRTYGETRDCAGCRYWSERIARAGGGTDNPAGDVEAMCLGPDEGPKRGKYTTARATCGEWKRGDLGPIDDPYEPDVARAYEMFDAQVAAGHDPAELISDIADILARDEPVF